MDFEIIKLIVEVILFIFLLGPLACFASWACVRMAKDFRREVDIQVDVSRSFEFCCDMVSRYYLERHNKEIKEDWENKQSDLEPF